MRRYTTLAAVLALLVVSAIPAGAGGNGNTQVEGLGEFDVAGVCQDAEGAGSDLAIILTGDLNGCLYGWVGPGGFNPSFTYKEVGTEVFVGCLADGTTCGTFDTTYLFTAKYADANFNGQEWGRCQHPIVKGSGTGDFSGITGRIDFKDDVVAGNADYRGHIKLAG